MRESSLPKVGSALSTNMHMTSGPDQLPLSGSAFSTPLLISTGLAAAYRRR